MKYGAFGIVEVLGTANAVLVADQMLKASQVTFRTWDYKCGGHVCLFISGDVSSVTAAIDTVKFNPPCEIHNAAVISNPSEETILLIEERAVQFHFA